MLAIRKLPLSIRYCTKFQSTIVLSPHTTRIQKYCSVINQNKNIQTTCMSYRSIMRLAANKSDQSTSQTDTLTEDQAYDMIHKLSDNDRASLSKALNSFEKKSKFQGEIYK